ncbi:MAG: hypothetical protein ACTHN5_21740 [Phycisphaerae bacterium]
MKRFNTYALVAALALGGAGVTFGADNGMDANNNMQTQSQMAGQQADQSTQREVRSTLAKVVNDAVSTNHFDNLNGYLAKSDKDRLSDMKKTDVNDLNSAINQFRADFKNKYNQDFDIQSEHFNDALIQAGQDKKSASVMIPNADLDAAGSNLNRNDLNSSNLNSSNAQTHSQNYTPATPAPPAQPGMTNGAPADRTLNTPPGEVTASNRNGQQSGATVDTTYSGKATGPASSGSNANSTVHGNDVNANPGLKRADDNMASNTSTVNTGTELNNNGAPMNTAIATAGSDTLHLVNEGHIMNAWRLDVPDQISAEQLKQNLVKQIRMLDDQKATWPSDVNAAYRSVAYHVLHSFSDSSLASER